MRNLRSAGMWAARVLVSAGMVVSFGGCAPQEGAAGGPGAAAAKPAKPLKPKQLEQALEAASAKFQQRQYREALAEADAVLSSNPQGAGAAEAHYIRGRVFEQRSIEAAAAKDIPRAKASQQAAREAYNAALTHTPAPVLEGDIRAQLANVAYYQDDYTAAIAQGTAAYQKVAEPQAKAWVLYLVGLSQQRVGSFTEADRTFAAVQQEFPNTDQARRAAAHQGARGFHVQVGTFSSQTNADAALAELRAQGVIGLSLPNASGQHVVRVGPVQTYEQAKGLKARVVGKYADAMIVP